MDADSSPQHDQGHPRGPADQGKHTCTSTAHTPTATSTHAQVAKKLGKKKKEMLYTSFVMSDRTVDLMFGTFDEKEEFLKNLETLITSDFKMRMTNCVGAQLSHGVRSLAGVSGCDSSVLIASDSS